MPKRSFLGAYVPMCPSVLMALLLLAASWSVRADEDPIGDLIQKEIKESRPELVIVIDPGHGGKDTGAIGYKAVREKDIVLQLSQRLAQRLSDHLGAHVIMTRKEDVFISLDDRDAISVQQKADLFISIHANAAERKDAAGIEIYYLNNATDEAAKRLAERENKSVRKKIANFEQILSSMIQTESTVLSRLLAEETQKALQRRLGNRYALGRLDVKSALFYVLVGAQAPSILLEIGFVTNPAEAQRLTKDLYQEELARAITLGIESYLASLEKKNITL